MGMREPSSAAESKHVTAGPGLSVLSCLVFFSCGYRVNPGSGEGETYDPGHHNPQF